MYTKKRVLFNGRGCEIAIETEGIREHLVFTANNGSGLSGDNLKQIEDNARATIAAANEFITMLEDFKESVNDRAPAMLGYQGYVSAKELKKQDMESKMDNVLKSIKSYVREEGEEEAI
jgi:hypothetical protein